MDNDLLDNDIEKPKVLYNGYASFFERFGAAFLDGILVTIVGYLILGAFGISFMDMIDATKNNSDPILLFGSKFIYASILSLFFDWFYFVQQEISEHQATLGKRAMGLIVTDAEGQRLNFMQASVRFLGKQIFSVVSLLTAYLSQDIITTLFFMSMLGYLIQPFTAKKQAFHDLVAKTLVYRK